MVHPILGRSELRIAASALATIFWLCRPCPTAASADDDAPFVAIGAPDQQDALRDMLVPLDAQRRNKIEAFYEARDFMPVWSDTARAERLRAILEHAFEQGLRASDYAVPDNASGSRLELALTDALFRYAHDVREGRAKPTDVYTDVRLPAIHFDFATALGAALKNDALDALLADLPPPQTEYRALVTALARYRAIKAQGGWPILPLRGEIALDGKDTRSNLLAQRLAFEDPVLAAGPDPSPDDIKAALVRYQRRNGLTDDGRPGGDTLKQLNVPVAARIEQIVANMERWRWLPRRFETRYIRVNVPDQSVDYVRDGDIVLHSRVVIGKPTSPTPILRTEVVAVVANPSWDIPGDIADKQVLPHLRRDHGYLAERGFTLVNGPPGDPAGEHVDWRKATQLPYQLRQPPGPNNVLGALMLDSPNDFDVYMHDTANKALFGQTQREASNGCVRVERIATLASLALTGDPSDGLDRIGDAISAGETRSLPLDHPLPVYMLYWTAIADADGTAGFRPDRYGRDARLLAWLAAPQKAPVTRTPAQPARIRRGPSPGSG